MTFEHRGNFIIVRQFLQLINLVALPFPEDGELLVLALLLSPVPVADDAAREEDAMQKPISLSNVYLVL